MSRRDWLSRSPQFDAVEHLRSWIGEREWPEFYEFLSSFGCAICFEKRLRQDYGVTDDFVVQSFWELIKGGATWDKALASDREKHINTFFRWGQESAQMEAQGTVVLVRWEGEPQDWEAQAYQDGRASIKETKQ